MVYFYVHERLITGRVLLHKSGRTCAPVELGQINSIKTAELTSLAGIIRSLTISFTVDGQRLYIIDNRVHSRENVFLRAERTACIQQAANTAFIQK